MSKRKKTSDKHATQAWSATSLPSLMRFAVPAGAIIIIAAAVIAFSPSINGDFILDDNILLTENEIIKSSDGLYRLWCTAESQDYWPVTNTTLWIEWRLWKMNPTGYHVTNLALHIAESLLIWLILRKLSIPGAFFAALIFAVHPVNVESVAWISQRKNTTAMLFFLLSILCYLKIEAQTPGASSGAKLTLSTNHSPLPTSPSFIPHPSSFILWYSLSLATFILAMLSKGSVAVLPLLLLGIIWWQRSLTRWDIVRIATFFAIAIVLAGVNIWFQTHGTGEVIRDASFAQRILGAGGMVWFYLYKAIFPINLIFIYPLWHIQTDNPLWWLPLLAALIVTAVLWSFRKSWSRPFLFAWGFFCVALIPAMGFADVGFMKYSLVADRYQHIAIIALIALVSSAFGTWHQYIRGKARMAATIFAIAAVGVLALLTWRQSGLYKDKITLYQATLKKNPDSWMIHNNLGNALSDTGRRQEAYEHFIEALRLKPDYAEAYNNLGFALANKGLASEAMANYRQAISIKPDAFEAHYNLGNSLVNIGRPEEAIEHYLSAVRIKPNWPEAQNNLGYALNIIDQIPEAIKHLKLALQANPNYEQPYYNLGNIFLKTGQFQEAVEHFQHALLLKPDYLEAHVNLGVTLVKTGRFQEAIEHYQYVLSVKPDFTEVYYDSASAHAKMGRSAQAVAIARKGLEIARSKGQAELAKKFEDWLHAHQGHDTTDEIPGDDGTTSINTVK